MQYSHLIAKSAFEPLNHLRCKGNLRHKNNRLPSLRNTSLDRLQIHFRLAAAGHPVQQKYTVLMTVQATHYMVKGFLLLWR
ncbi:hypothetical protein D3C81_904170 [compost metagenome]